jgi:hypothetical protein
LKWRDFFNSLTNQQSSELIRFFFLQALTDIVKTKFQDSQNSRGLDISERCAFVQASIDFLLHSPEAVLAQPYFRSKYA